MTGRAFVGTSGWAYASWKQKFYPADVKAKDLLRHYATRLGTNEVNYTFNHLPTQRNIDSWKEQTPDDFVFALKASQYITHIKKLEEPTVTLPKFFDAVRPLGERLGPILFQTPPWLKRNDELLSMFVVALPDDARCALEVRDPSWYTDDVYALLRARNVALVHGEGERAPSPVETDRRDGRLRVRPAPGPRGLRRRGGRDLGRAAPGGACVRDGRLRVLPA